MTYPVLCTDMPLDMFVAHPAHALWSEQALREAWRMDRAIGPLYYVTGPTGGATTLLVPSGSVWL